MRKEDARMVNLSDGCGIFLNMKMLPLNLNSGV